VIHSSSVLSLEVFLEWPGSGLELKFPAEVIVYILPAFKVNMILMFMAFHATGNCLGVYIFFSFLQPCPWSTSSFRFACMCLVFSPEKSLTSIELWFVLVILCNRVELM